MAGAGATNGFKISNPLVGDALGLPTGRIQLCGGRHSVAPLCSGRVALDVRTFGCGNLAACVRRRVSETSLVLQKIHVSVRAAPAEVPRGGLPRPAGLARHRHHPVVLDEIRVRVEAQPLGVRRAVGAHLAGLRMAATHAAVE